jgi:hypothetical protein
MLVSHGIPELDLPQVNLNIELVIFHPIPLLVPSVHYLKHLTAFVEAVERVKVLRAFGQHEGPNEAQDIDKEPEELKVKPLIGDEFEIEGT